MLSRYWKAWSPLPPPPSFHMLLDSLRQGHGMDLYASP